MINIDKIDGQGSNKCLIHLDRLSMTLRYNDDSKFKVIRNPDLIPGEQTFGDITLVYNRSRGIAIYYHSFAIYYKGDRVGVLYTGQKMNRKELQLDFEKQLFYSYANDYWYEVFNSILFELGIQYNNIRYIEIAVDTDKDILQLFRYLFQHSENNLLNCNIRFRMKSGMMVHSMNNGQSFIIQGTDNEIAIYEKTKHAEDYIMEFFQNNGFKGQDVYRVECRLTWDYIRYLRNKQHLDINPETLLDQGKLATLFKVATNDKTEFKDLDSKYYTKSRNPKYRSVSIIDCLAIEASTIPVSNPDFRKDHYKSDDIDLNILRQCYYQYIDSGNERYLNNIKTIIKTADFNNHEVSEYFRKFTLNYKGNRSPEKIHRMKKITKRYSNPSNFFARIFRRE